MMNAYSNMTKDEPVEILVQLRKSPRLCRQIVFQAPYAEPIFLLEDERANQDFSDTLPLRLHAECRLTLGREVFKDGSKPIRSRLGLRTRAVTIYKVAPWTSPCATSPPASRSSGHLVAFKREDGCGLLRVEIAQGKARGALGMGIPSRTIAQRLSNRPNFVTAVVAASGGEFVPVPGGVLILDARGAAIGAVGISGDTSDKDEYCAIQGVRGAGMTPDPAEPNPEWRAGGL